MDIFSYSRISTYFNCPKQYKFRYVDKIPSPVPEGIELFLGSRFHEAMEYLYQEIPREVLSLEKLKKYFQMLWEEKWNECVKKQKEKNFQSPIRIVRKNETMQDFFQKGQLFLENYYKKYYPFNQDYTEGLELKVLFDLDPEGQYKMQGYIDRLARDNQGILWIHDYKTNSRKLSKDDVNFDDQLALYQVGINQSAKYQSFSGVKLMWHFVAFSDNESLVSECTQEKLVQLKRKYISKIQKIKADQVYPTQVSRLCEWCEYLTLCPEGQKKIHEYSNISPPIFEMEKNAPSDHSLLKKSLDFQKDVSSYNTSEQLPLF